MVSVRVPARLDRRPMRDAVRLDARLAAALSGPRERPLALRGRSGSGKTTLLRRAIGRARTEAVWLTALDVVHDLSAAIREDRHASYCNGLAADARPLCVEHLEDLRGRPRTRAELRRLLERAARQRPVLMTFTRALRDTAVTRWLRGWTDLVSLDRSRRTSTSAASRQQRQRRHSPHRAKRPQS